MNDTRWLVSSLNRCIEACADTQRAYGIAAAEARNPDLKSEFQRRAEERVQFVIALQLAICKLGAFPENQGTFRGVMRRRWTALERGVEPKHDDHHVTADLLREERAALETYESAMPDARIEELPVDLRVMVREQHDAVARALAELSHHLAA